MSVFLIATDSISGTRSITMPLRVVIVLLLFVGYFGLRNRKHPSLTDRYNLTFLIFAAMYTLRILIESFADPTLYVLHRSPTEIFLSFVSFVLLPFLLVNRLNLAEIEIVKITNYVLIGLLLFAIFSTIAHSDQIGSGVRSEIIFGDENLLSPLILSYSGSLGIGIGMTTVLREKRPNFWAFTGLITCVASIFPFFLGGSRGAIISLALPILLLVVLMSRRQAIIALVASSIMILFIALASIYLGSELFERLLNTRERIGAEAGAETRVLLWRSSIEQFQGSPIFGDSLENLAFNFYPHNIFLEVMISTGLLGLIPFVTLIFMALFKCFSIMKYRPNHAGIVFMLVNSLIQSLFSGALYSASWLAISLALVAVTWRSLNLAHLQPSQRLVRGIAGGKKRSPVS